MDNPLVSIALATYNGERFLRAQLDSLLTQTYPHFELVITDDGSTDTTNAIVCEYMLRDQRIRWQKSKLQRGFINNFTGAISLCKGEIIFLCDQDDIWYRDKIAKHVAKYQDSSVVWVCNEVRLINETGEQEGYMTDTIPDYYTAKRRWILNYVWGSCILGCATSYRALCIRGLLPPDKYAPAHDSWLQLALWPIPPQVIGDVLQDYRIHDKNTSDFKLSRTDKELKAFELRAIKDNMIRLKSFSHNTNLAVWKRLLFFSVYVIKKVRRS